MPTRRTALTLTMSGILGGALAACGAPAPVRELRYRGVPGTVTPAELADDLGFLDGVRLRWAGDSAGGTTDLQSAVAGDLDIATARNDAIVRQRAAGAPITAVIGGYGTDKDTYTGFYVLRTGPIRTARDLIGKRIGVATRDGDAAAITRTYLTRAGLTPAEIARTEFRAVAPDDTEQWLRAGRIDIAALPGTQPAPARLRVLFTDFALLGPYTIGSLILRSDLIERDPALARAFTTGVARAIDWARVQPREAVLDRFTTIRARRARTADGGRIPPWRGYGLAGRGGALADTDFSAWITGGLTAPDVYTNEFNGVAMGEAG